MLEQWSISSTPTQCNSISFQFSGQEVDIDRYPQQVPKAVDLFPLVPDRRCIPAPNAVYLSTEANLLRIGGSFFIDTRQEENCKGFQFEQLTGPAFMEAWEDSCCRGNLIVLSRRRTLRPVTIDEAREERRRHALRRKVFHFQNIRRSGMSQSRRTSQTKKQPRTLDSYPSVMNQGVPFLNVSLVEEDSPSDQESSDDLSQSGSDDLSSDYLPEISSPDDSLTEGLMNTDDNSSDSISSAHPGLSDNESDILVESDIDIKSTGEDGDVSSIDGGAEANQSDSDNSQSVRSISEYLGYANSEEESVGEYEDDSSGESGASDRQTKSIGDAERGQEINIQGPKGVTECDACGKGQKKEWYRCLECSKGNFDICRACKNGGRWCLNLGHRLYRMIHGQPAGAVSRTNFNIRQEIVVCRGSTRDDFKPVFHLRKRYKTLLYESPPIIHTTQPLVVWPLTESSLLFADFERDRCFEHRLDALLSRRPNCKYS